MEILERIEIERECERLVTKYCHYVDHGEAARIADLFTEDGVWQSVKTTMTGRDGIRKAYQRRQENKGRMSRHVCHNLLIDVISATEATGTVYITLYRDDGDPERPYSPLVGPLKVGEYRDHFLKTEDGWRFARREIVVNFGNPSA